MADETSAGVTQDSKSEAEATGEGFVRSWLEAIGLADKEEEKWRKKAQDALDIYRGKEGKTGTKFNIFFANTETICPAVYNSTPEPDVRRRYNDKDPVGKQVADILERALSYSVDNYDFDAVMKAIVRDGEIAGRGVPRVRYIPHFGPSKDEMGQPVMDEEGNPVEEVVDEAVECDYVPWRQFRRGPGLLWEHVSWVAFGDYLDKDELTKLVGAEQVEQVPFNFSAGSDGTFTNKGSSKEATIFKRAFIWQIWDRQTRRVIYICPDYGQKALRVVDDPLQLTGFFPNPRPYQPVLVTDSLTPIVPYSIYENLSIELNTVTERITKLVKQLKPRGLYAGNAADIASVAEADDGELKPAQMIEAFVNGKGLDSAISWFPLDPTVKALIQLVSQREQIKQTIYEVTGIADILRGATEASETATAQQLKAQWGSVRIQDRQGEVARVARDLFRLKAEIMASKFSPEKLSAMTGIEVTPEIEAVLRDDLLRAYRIDIESDSTIRGDMQRNQSAMAEFINGTAQYAAAVAPITEQFPPLAQPFIEVYTAFARQFNLGKQAEDALDSLADTARQAQEQAAQQEQQPSPEELEQQRVQKETDASIARDDATAQSDIVDKQARLKMDQEKHQHEMSMGRREMTLKAAAHNKALIDEAGEEEGGTPPNLDQVAPEQPTALEKSLGAITQMTQALLQSIEALKHAHTEAQAKQAENDIRRDIAHMQVLTKLGDVAKIAAAPKEAMFIRDEQGRPIGARSTPTVN